MLGRLHPCRDLPVPLPRSILRGRTGRLWRGAAPLARPSTSLASQCRQRISAQAPGRRVASICISITLFLVMLCKFFATSWMWGVLASNSSVTAQQFKQAVPLVKKIKGFVISYNKRGLLGQPSEILLYLAAPLSSQPLLLPIPRNSEYWKPFSLISPAPKVSLQL